MTKKTGTKWKTEKCGRCGKPHKNYSGKLDKSNFEYVVCEGTNKRMNVYPGGAEANSFAFPSVWVKENKA